MSGSVLRRVWIRAARVLGQKSLSSTQLELVLPSAVRDIKVPEPPAGYRLRPSTTADESALVRLLQRAGFDFSSETLRDALSICLPRGCFVVEHGTSGVLAATMMARHLASAAHPFGGRIDWLATDPDHRRQGLAGICARSAVRRLIEAGYEDIWVTTDDHRLGALKIFLGIGFIPAVHEVSRERWAKVCKALDL